MKEINDLEKIVKRKEKWELFLFKTIDLFFFAYLGLMFLMMTIAVILFFHILALGIILLIISVLLWILFVFIIEYYRKVDYQKCYRKTLKQKEKEKK